MEKDGWYNKPGVNVLQGKWQDFVGTDKLAQFGDFDVIYTDTFSEDYDGTSVIQTHSPCLTNTECRPTAILQTRTRVNLAPDRLPVQFLQWLRCHK